MTEPPELYRYKEVQRKLTGRVKSDIEMRWAGRIESQALHELGADGARIYLEKYGRNISEEKLVGLAYKAEVEGYQEMADVFWLRAYERHKESEARAEPQGQPAPRRGIPRTQENILRVGKAIYESFNIDELRSLCHELGIDDEDIPQTTKNEMARELIRYTVRRNIFSELVEKCRELRPQKDWGDSAR